MTRAGRRVRSLAAVLVAAGSLQAVAGPKAPVLVPIAEGFTASRKGEGIDVAPRRFTAPDLGAICAGLPVPSALVAARDTIEVVAGTPFDPSSIEVVAVNSAGAILKPLPIVVELEEVDPPILDRRAYVESGGPITVFRDGTLRLRVRTICVEPGPQFDFRLVVSGSRTGLPLTPADITRLAEAFHLARHVVDRIFPGWSETSFPVVVVTADRDVLIDDREPPAGFLRHPAPPELGRPLAERPRTFAPDLFATFPAFDARPVVVVGLPSATGKTSTSWVLSLIHEHLHQLQMGDAEYQEQIARLDLAGDDTTGAWMLDYPFPYDDPSIGFALEQLGRQAASAIRSDEPGDRAMFWTRYSQLLGGLNDKDRRYMAFQFWQEGVGRFVEIRAAELAARTYEPTAAFAALDDAEPFADAAKRLRETLLADLEGMKVAAKRRETFYPLGAAIALLLDGDEPSWRSRYLARKFTLEPPS